MSFRRMAATLAGAFAADAVGGVIGFFQFVSPRLPVSGEEWAYAAGAGLPWAVGAAFLIWTRMKTPNLPVVAKNALADDAQSPNVAIGASPNLDAPRSIGISSGLPPLLWPRSPSQTPNLVARLGRVGHWLGTLVSGALLVGALTSALDSLSHNARWQAGHEAYAVGYESMWMILATAAVSFAIGRVWRYILAAE